MPTKIMLFESSSRKYHSGQTHSSLQTSVSYFMGILGFLVFELFCGPRLQGFGLILRQQVCLLAVSVVRDSIQTFDQSFFFLHSTFFAAGLLSNIQSFKSQEVQDIAAHINNVLSSKVDHYLCHASEHERYCFPSWMELQAESFFVADWVAGQTGCHYFAISVLFKNRVAQSHLQRPLSRNLKV